MGDAPSCPLLGYDVFGNPYSATDPNGSVTCYAYDVMGRELTEVHLADHTLDRSITYTADNQVATVSIGTPVETETVNFYGGGVINTLIQGGAGTAALPTQVEHLGASAGGGLALVSLDETVYISNAGGTQAYGNKPLLERSLGSTVTNNSIPVSCSLGGGTSCSSDESCGSGSHCAMS